MKYYLKLCILVIFGMILSVILNIFVLAFDYPAQTPPDCAAGSPGCDAPINVSATTQYKLGALGIDGVFQAYNSAYLATSGGNVGIGMTILNPLIKLQIVGDGINPAIKFSPTSTWQSPNYSHYQSSGTYDLGSANFCMINSYWANSNFNSTTDCTVYYDSASSGWKIYVGASNEAKTSCSAICMRSITNDLYGGQHASSDCASLGGAVNQDTGVKLCKFEGVDCPSSWNRFSNQTSSNTCSASGGSCFAIPLSCNTGSHSYYSNVPIETCSYGYSFFGNCRISTCTANIVRTLCY